MPEGPGGMFFGLLGLWLMHRQVLNEQGGYLWDPVPAGLPSPGDGVVHDVISHQEECLQLQGTQSPVSSREKAEKVQRGLSCTFLVVQCVGMQQQTRSPLQLCVRALHKHGQRIIGCLQASERQRTEVAGSPIQCTSPKHWPQTAAD